MVENLEQAVRDMKRNAQEFQDRVPRLISNMMTLLETAESRRVEAKVNNIRAHVEHLSFGTYEQRRKFQILLRRKPMIIRRRITILREKIKMPRIYLNEEALNQALQQFDHMIQDLNHNKRVVSNVHNLLLSSWSQLGVGKKPLAI